MNCHKVWNYLEFFRIFWNFLEDVFGDAQIPYPKREYLTDEEKPKKTKTQKPLADDNPTQPKRPRLDNNASGRVRSS